MHDTLSRTTSPLMTTAQLASYLSVPVSTIYKWRTTGTEPTGAAHRVGRYLRWNIVAVDAWLDARLTKSVPSNG
jgi:excisionase family DNA binding protein